MQAAGGETFVKSVVSEKYCIKRPLVFLVKRDNGNISLDVRPALT